MTKIKNGRAYPLTLKNAVVARVKSGIGSNSTIAKEFNIHKSTVGSWKRQAKLQAAVPVGLAMHQAASAALKAYNTPTLQPDGSITYRGKNYK